MGYDFRPAQRSQAKPLIGLYSQSGTGKTYTSLVVARGFVGPAGRIGMIETESGRGEAYADKKEYPEIGGYDVLSLREDFSPRAFGEAIAAAEKAKLDALIIDSGSHEWDGVGGVLDMAAKNQAGGTKGVLVWQQPKIEHKRYFMLRLLQTPIPLIILCMRAKYPMEKKGNDWVRSGQLEPTQAEDVLYEMFVHGWMDHDHNFHLTKCTAKALQPIFGNKKPLSVETGRALADWARNSPKAETVAGPAAQTATAKTAVPFLITDALGNTHDLVSAANWGSNIMNKIYPFQSPEKIEDFLERNVANFDAVAAEYPHEVADVRQRLEQRIRELRQADAHSGGEG